MAKPKKVLFVCVENAGRSQMAEGFLRKFAPHLDVISAGTNPRSQLILTVIDVIDWDISDPKDKDIEKIREIRDQIKNEV